MYEAVWHLTFLSCLMQLKGYSESNAKYQDNPEASTWDSNLAISILGATGYENLI